MPRHWGRIARLAQIPRMAGCVLLCLSATASIMSAEVIERLLAIVSGHLIMASDVEAVRRFGVPGVTGTDGEVLDRLIDAGLDSIPGGGDVAPSDAFTNATTLANYPYPKWRLNQK